MKIKLLLSIILLASTVCIAQVSIGKLEPNKSAQLEVVSSNKGLLIPKITLTSLTDVATITNGNIDGLTVFNTSSTADLKPGYYYWHTDRWNRLITKDEVGEGSSVTNSTFSQDGTDLILTDSDNNKVSIALADINTTNSSLAKSIDGLNLELTDSDNNKVSIALADIDSADLKMLTNNNHLTSDAGINGDGTSLGNGTDNIAIGKSSMLYATNANSNISIGSNTLEGGYTGSNMESNGDENIAIGNQALRYNIAGNKNIAIGVKSGKSVKGNKNIILGYDINLVNNYEDNQLNIGNIIFGTGIDGTGTTMSTGNIGIGVANPTERLEVSGNLKSKGLILNDNDDSNSITIKSPTDITTDYTLTLPTDDGNASQVLTTDGSGVLSWTEDKGGVFIQNGTVITNITDATDTSEDFVFGSTQLDDDTSTTEDNSRMFFDKSKGAFRTGTTTGDEWDNIQYDHDGDDTSPSPTAHVDKIGNYSIAMGRNTIASGDNSTSIGNETKAIGNYSIAMGLGTEANGFNSMSMGVGTVSSGHSSTAMGNSTRATGESSIAMGNGTKANGTSSTSMGNGTIANGYFSTAMGYSTTAPSYGETTIGFFNTGYTLSDTDNSGDGYDSTNKLYSTDRL
ncbi:MAG: hypothetical protein HRT66_09010, partial [Flavobacteriaceae bacterium]|nr:hypothetical protein [Flavobacteriaceae bacterium]